jgi:hypothetical protein
VIITAALNVIYTVLSVLLVFQLPELPASVITVANTAVGYVTSGVNVIHLFIGNTAMGVLTLCFKLVILFNAAYFLYSVVMWVLRKVPFLGLKE